jgi:hypothetical protein
MIRAAAVALCLIGLTSQAVAEVRAVEHPNRGWSIEFSTPRGEIWTPQPAHLFDDHVLNAVGDKNGDGLPAVGVRPTLGTPEAVFAWRTNEVFELVFARHEGLGWGPSRNVTIDATANDISPILAYDDHGRSMLAWQKIGDTSAMMVAGLSLEARLWGQQVSQTGAFRPLVMKSDGEDFYLTGMHLEAGVLRVDHVAFPFPDGGPSLPFPDDTLNRTPIYETFIGADLPEPPGMGPDSGPREIPLNRSASLAAVTMEAHRDGDTVWIDWVTADSSVRWAAFRGPELLEEGEEPFGAPQQIDQARRRIADRVSGL